MREHEKKMRPPDWAAAFFKKICGLLHSFVHDECEIHLYIKCRYFYKKLNIKGFTLDLKIMRITLLRLCYKSIEILAIGNQVC